MPKSCELFVKTLAANRHVDVNWWMQVKQQTRKQHNHSLWRQRLTRCVAGRKTFETLLLCNAPTRFVCSQTFFCITKRCGSFHQCSVVFAETCVTKRTRDWKPQYAVQKVLQLSGHPPISISMTRTLLQVWQNKQISLKSKKVCRETEMKCIGCSLESGHIASVYGSM